MSSPIWYTQPWLFKCVKDILLCYHSHTSQNIHVLSQSKHKWFDHSASTYYFHNNYCNTWRVPEAVRKCPNNIHTSSKLLIMSPQEVFISAIPIPCLGYNVSKRSKASTYPSRPLQETHPARRALTSTASSATSTEPRIYILHVPTAYAT